MYVCMYEKVATMTVSIEETVSLDQREKGPDRDSYFPITCKICPFRNKTKVTKTGSR